MVNEDFVSERIDEILDKILKYGIESLTEFEKKILDIYSQGKDKKEFENIIAKEKEYVFVDDNGFFKFEFKKKVIKKDFIEFCGTLYVPDLKISNNKIIKGILNGKIIYYKNDLISLDFREGKYDIFDFCSGIEYELDNFIEFVVLELLRTHIRR